MLHLNAIRSVLLRYRFVQKIYVTMCLLRLRQKGDVAGLYELHDYLFSVYGGDLQKHRGILFLQGQQASDKDVVLWEEYMNRLVQAVYDKDATCDVDVLFRDAREMFSLFFRYAKGVKA